MAHIVIQMGHVPRTSGATGTYREQEFNKAIGPALRDALAARGHQVSLIGADESVPQPANVFVALHTDGNTNKSIKGASVGYPDAAGGKLAAAWKRAHQRHGYPSGFHADNYTKNLRYYYGFGKSSAQYRFLAEHGTTTNPDDEAWLFSHLTDCVMAHVDAIGEVVGHPQTPVRTPRMNLTLAPGVSIVDYVKHPDGGIAQLLSDGGVWCFDCPFMGNVFGKDYFKGKKATAIELNPHAEYPQHVGEWPWYIIRDEHNNPYGLTGF